MTLKKIKTSPIKRLGKEGRKYKILHGLIEHFIEKGVAVGSEVLKEEGFQDLSSATIRNYFVELEEEGLLKQPHISGGRIPTEKSYNLYVNDILKSQAWETSKKEQEVLEKLKKEDTKAVANYIQKGAEKLSELTRCAVFLSAPRFDQDFVTDIRLLSLDNERCLGVLMTDFGLVHTQVLPAPSKLSLFQLRRLEEYFRWRITGVHKPEFSDLKEEKLAQDFYKEIMMRYIVGYSNFSQEDIYRTGFSRLLEHPNFEDIKTLASGLSLFEDPMSMRTILNASMKENKILFWVGNDLKKLSLIPQECAVVTIPYYINQSVVGSIGLLGPMRLPYKKILGTLKLFTEVLSEGLTRNIYKFKISYRQPEKGVLYLDKRGYLLENHSSPNSKFKEK